MFISVIGTGYVGLSLAVLISRKHTVVAVDVIPEKVEMINARVSPIVDNEITDYLSSSEIKLKATTDIRECVGSDYIIIATPTNYDVDSQMFDTSSVENVIDKLEEITPNSVIVVKSTVPIGFVESISRERGVSNILFSPEFLREGRALYDNLHPSRIIVGIPFKNKEVEVKARGFLNLLAECAVDSTETLIMGSTEAESVKLFSNTYLAMRVSFFNELDTYAERNNLDTRQIIEGVCLDPRIGNSYNNPSFGYGGYCLPKDTKQLLANYRTVPNSLIEAIVTSNEIRKKFVAETVEKESGKEGATIGIYRLIMKNGSDNFRESSVFDIMKKLRGDGYQILVYEPTVCGDYYKGWCLDNNLNSFIGKCDIIMANRMSSELENVRDKVFCRDIFNRD